MILILYPEETKWVIPQKEVGSNEKGLNVALPSPQARNSSTTRGSRYLVVNQNKLLVASPQEGEVLIHSLEGSPKIGPSDMLGFSP